jgi:hypothetical protein
MPACALISALARSGNSRKKNALAEHPLILRTVSKENEIQHYSYTIWPPLSFHRTDPDTGRSRKYIPITITPIPNPLFAHSLPLRST